MPDYQLLLLGPVQVRRDHKVVPLSVAKAIARSGYLAVTGLPHRRDHLIDLLWPQSLPEAARRICATRSGPSVESLERGCCTSRRIRIGLAEMVHSDVQAYETAVAALLAAQTPAVSELQAAVELHRGPLLDGLALVDASEYELWLTAERSRLGQLHLQILEALVARQRSTSDWRGVISSAQRALAQDSLQEPMQRTLMEAYARVGERADALRQYDLLRTNMLGELGVEPLPETEALRARILSGEVGPVTRPVGDALPRSRRAPRATAQADRPFVGRQAEFVALDEEYHRAAGGRAQVVLLSGELGIGKSRLWQQWSATLPPQAVVLETRCLDTTQALPYAPMIALFGKQIRMGHITDPEALVSPVWLVELARLVPEMREYRPELPLPTSLPPEEERLRLFEAFTQILCSLAAPAVEPLILFVDDLHWADRATLDWLIYLLDRLREDPVLLVGAYRANEAPPELAQHVATWLREDLVRQLSLSHLTVEEATELLDGLGGNVKMAGYLHVQSGGNPYYLTELSNVFVDGMPAELAELVRVRLNALPDDAQQVLQVAAVLEPNIDFDVLCRTSQRNEAKTLDALDTRSDAAVLVERGQSYEFAHPLVASIVRKNLRNVRRKILHRLAAEVIEADHAGNVQGVAGQLAHHYAQAGRHVEAARYAEMAAELALQMAATTEAVAFYRQANTLDPTPTRLLELGHALVHVPGGVHEACEAMQNALAQFESRQDQAGMVRAGLRLAFSYFATEEGDKVLDRAQRILSELDVADDVELRASAQYLMASSKFLANYALDEAEAHFREATRLATEHSLASEIAILSWFGWGNLSVQRGDFAAAQAQFNQALQLARAGHNIYFEALCGNNLAYATYLAGDLDAAWAVLERALDFVETSSLMRPRQYLYSTRGEFALARGGLDDAESWFQRAIEEAESYDNRTLSANIGANLGRVAQERGDLDKAEALLLEAQRAVSAMAALHLQIQIELWLAELYLQRDEPASAERP